MHFRNKGGHPTINLCNQFLVTYLESKKKHCEKIGMERKSFVYHNAIQNIKKYPLPIISSQQLKLLYGIGDTLREQLVAVIKQHYRGYLKKKLVGKGEIDQIQNTQKQPFEENDQQTMAGCRSLSLFKKIEKRKQHKNVNSIQKDEDDTMSMKSFKSATVRPYKPRPRTQGASALLAVYKYGEGDYISTQMLLGKLREECHVKITPKALIVNISNLCKSGYIQQRIDEKGTLVKITNKGLAEVSVLEAKTMQKESSLKVKSMVHSFLQQKQNKTQPVQSIQSRIQKKQIYFQSQFELVLLIDTRQIKDKNQQNFFENKLAEKYNITIRTCNLPIGDFMWQYNGQILDYVVERKTADDLISSIQDGRYKQQKYRLKNSGFSNIYYLFEGHLTGGYAKNQRAVTTALMNTRIMDKFKVVQLGNITQSLKFLNFVTQEIQKNITGSQNVTSLGSIEEVTAINGKAGQLTVEHIFGLGLKTIPGVGRSAINQILNHFRTFRQLYEKLSQLQNRFERVQFLRQMLKGSSVRSTLPEIVVGVLFAE